MNGFLDEIGIDWLVAARASDVATYPRARVARRLKLVDFRATDLAALDSMPDLVVLDTENVRVERLDGLESLEHLRHVNLSLRRGTTDIAALRHRPELVSLGIFPADAIEDLSPLRHLVQLRDLAVGHLEARSAQRLGQVPFAALTGLERLRWRCDVHASIDDLSPLSPLTELRALELEELVVTCPLDVLHQLPNLREVWLVHADAARERERFAEVRPDVQVWMTPPPEQEVSVRGELDFGPSEVFIDDDTWWVYSAELTERLGVATNYEAEERMRAAIEVEAPEAAPRLQYDTEADAFCVRSTEAEDLEVVRRVINDLP